ncbi:MAG: hypothetical protein Q4G13_01400 [Moraxella sp.]|nr:hypothetical protein [Moraxella sp.]
MAKFPKFGTISHTLSWGQAWSLGGELRGFPNCGFNLFNSGDMARFFI